MVLLEFIRDQSSQKFDIISNEINCVLSCSDEYNEDQLKCLVQAAKNSGMNHVKSITEVVATCLGTLELDKF